MADFQTAYDYLHALEGGSHNLGYVNIDSDLGGETIGGRTRYWKATKGKMPTDIEIWSHVDLLKEKDDFPANLNNHSTLPMLISRAYERDEWRDILGDMIPDQLVANEVFEFAVHKEARTSVKILQYCVNKLNYNGRLFEDLVEDGFMGAKTIKAISILMARKVALDTLLKMFNCEQGHYYNERFTKSPSQEVNAIGFYRRVEITKTTNT
ncbi:hypothetical protein LCGC14_1718770 [marine sediment metagenome]|uniref:Peptidoglycan binding domain-containing protein n=1 Tax=marine sediment metagenome TaxID=412755 RepID=A0A0F9HDC2_9ZZZZ